MADYGMLFRGGGQPKMLDLGQVYRDAEAIKTNRARRNALETINRREDALEKERAAYAGGDTGALGRMVTISPDEAVKFKGAIDKMGEAERAEALKKAETIGRAAAMILTAPAADRARIYGEIRATLPDEWKAKMPETYSEGLVMQIAAGAKETFDLLKIDMRNRNALALEDKKHANDSERDATKHSNALALEGAKNDNALTRDREKADAAMKREEFKAEARERVEKIRGEYRVKTKSTGGSGAGGLKPTVSNSIRSAAASLFDGLYDPTTGEMAFTSKDSAQNALNIAARAEEIYKQNPGLGTNEAVQRAYREVTGGSGGDEKTGGGDDTDPLRIRD